MKQAHQNDRELHAVAQLRTQRFYEVYAKTNHAIIHSRTPDVLFEKICTAAVTLKMCDAAWIGMLQDDGALMAVASAGVPIELIQAIKYRIDDPFLQAHSVAVKAIMERKPCLQNDYLSKVTEPQWAAEMQRIGISSAGAFPIFRLGKVVGAFSIGDAQSAFFNEELNALLAELADSISFFLDTEIREQERRAGELAIRDAELRYRTLVDLSPDGIFIYKDRIATFVNCAALQLFGADETTDLAVFNLPKAIHPDDWPIIEQRSQRLAAGLRNSPIVLRGVRLDGSVFDLELSSAPFSQAGTNTTIVVARDVTGQRARERLIQEQARILERTARGEPLPGILEHITHLIERQTTGLHCSIMLLAEDGEHLINGGPSSLSPAFCAAIEGAEIGPLAGSCGAAAFLRKAIIVTDIAHDPLWKDYREIALAHDLRACWSTPIFASDGELIGTFALYASESRAPSENENALVRILSGVAAVAIERDRAHRKLLKTQGQLLEAQRLARTGDWKLDFVAGQFYGSDVVFDILGLDQNGGVIDLEAFMQIVHPLDRARLIAARAATLSGIQEQTNVDYRIVRPDGAIRHVEVRGVFTIDVDGKQQQYTGVMQDITERKDAEQALALYKRALESASSGIVICDALAPDMPMISVNQAFERITGYASHEAVGQNCRFLQGEQTDQAGLAEIRDALAHNKEGHAVLLNYRKDGTPFWNDLSVAPVRNPDRTVTHFIGSITDVSDAIRYEKELAFQANHDALTALPNRNLLEDRLEQAISFAKRRERPVGIVFVDLDNFKSINDTLGHQIGDRLLKVVAERFSASLRDGDTVSRLGGDEFVVLCADLTGPRDMDEIISRIFKNLRIPVLIDNQQISIDASMGVALFPQDGQSAAELLKCADMAMYRAKASGRGNNQFYVAEMGVKVSQRRKTEQELRLALENEEFELYYQPKVGSRSGEICGMEALIRWNHPERGVVPPFEFIQLAEESNLIIPIGEWVMFEACRQNQAWRTAGLSNFSISVNVSPAQFRQKNLSDIVLRALKQSGLAPHLLELEITESLAMESPEQFIVTLETIKAIGVRISIDDFGTGYSSLSYLTRFPIDVLKIDRSFVRDITVDADDAAICRTIITLAKNLDLIVVAEGVETQAQASFLRRHQCDEVQGFLTCRPEPAAQITTRLQNRQNFRAILGGNESDQKKLLILDDDENSLEMIAMVLAQDGHHILKASSPFTALKMLAEHDVAVIITDQRMPEMSGVEFLQRAKNMHPESVRIVVSGHADFDSISEAVNRGSIYKFLLKPLDSELLRTTVGEALRHHELRLENHDLRSRID